MSVSKVRILSLYKQLLRESGKFSAYGFREYALRRTRASFQENKTLVDPEIIRKELEYATKNIEIIKRQVVIGDLYSSEKLVIEK